MAGFDRSKLKATTATAFQAQKQEHEQKRPSSNFDNTKLEIKPGDNKFRFFPYHPDSGIDTYSVAKTGSYLTVMKQKYDEQTKKKVEGVFEQGKKFIFNSKVHGNLPKDLVEEYLTFAKKVAIPNFTTDKATADKIWNFMTFAGKGSNAIKPSDEWVVYAVKEEGKNTDGSSIWGKVGELSIKRTVTEQLTEKAIEFSGDTATPDIYTDADEGICVIINKSGEGKDTKYKVSLDTVKTKQGNQLVSMSVATPLTDAQIDAWLKLPSLAKKFVNSFKRSDLQFQIEGLQYFDNFLASKGYPINVFAYEEFLATVEEISELVPEDEAEDVDSTVVEGEEGDGGEIASDIGAITEGEEEVTVVVPKPIAKPVIATPKPKVPVAPVVPAAKVPVVPRPTVTPKPAEAPAPAAGSEDRIAKIKAMMAAKK